MGGQKEKGEIQYIAANFEDGRRRDLSQGMQATPTIQEQVLADRK